MFIKTFIRKHRELFVWAYSLREITCQLFLFFQNLKNINDGLSKKGLVVYYLGVPAHANLGDLAQGVCIRQWLKKHYPNYHITEIETNALVNTRFSVLNKLKRSFDYSKDFVVFQSGYTTTDLGGHADCMHQTIINSLPNAKMLMMPQTIFFKSIERRELCSRIYNSNKNMLFLARDRVSYNMAEDMFPDIPKRCFPDIVTTLIGKNIAINENRNGIIFCLRDDGEKYFSDEVLQVFIDRCYSLTERIVRTDTTKNKKIVKNPEENIIKEIKEYSKYKVMVTDRYHGTIFSLAAGTPTVILKTTDHKVTTGAEWFKGIYDDHVFVAEDLEDAYSIVERIYNTSIDYELDPYFERNYYDILPDILKEELIHCF